MLKPMKSLILGTLCFWSISMSGQTLAKSILVEYGYPNIPHENAGLFTMFGITKYRVYADEKYLKIETYQEMSPEQAKQIGPTLRSNMVKDRVTNELFLCISLDTLHVRMKGGPEEQTVFNGMTETFNAGSEAFRGTGSKKIYIQGLSCNEVLVKGKFADTISAFVAPQIVLDPSIKDFPMYVAKGDKTFGLMMGRDEVLWDGNIIEFRATKLEVNPHIEISNELAIYQLVTKEEGEKRIKAMFTRMMNQAGKN